MRTGFAIGLGLSAVVLVGVIGYAVGRRAAIPDGKSRGRSAADFDPVQLRRGTEVELEHTSSRAIAQRIAMDHLTEDPKYYRKLAKFHVD
jgi:hypothetical protein